jgi:hypothetical protein
MLSTKPLPRLTSQAITNGDGLRRELAAVRERGYSIDNREFDEGAIRVAVPITDPGGVAAAALSPSGPAYRMVELDEAAVAGRLVRVRDDVADEMTSPTRSAGVAYRTFATCGVIVTQPREESVITTVRGRGATSLGVTDLPWLRQEVTLLAVAPPEQAPHRAELLVELPGDVDTSPTARWSIRP